MEGSERARTLATNPVPAAEEQHIRTVSLESARVALSSTYRPENAGGLVLLINTGG